MLNTRLSSAQILVISDATVEGGLPMISSLDDLLRRANSDDRAESNAAISDLAMLLEKSTAMIGAQLYQSTSNLGPEFYDALISPDLRELTIESHDQSLIIDRIAALVPSSAHKVGLLYALSKSLPTVGGPELLKLFADVARDCDDDTAFQLLIAFRNLLGRWPTARQRMQHNLGTDDPGDVLRRLSHSHDTRVAKLALHLLED